MASRPFAKDFEPSLVDRVMDIEQHDAEVFMRFAREEGIFAGVSSVVQRAA